MNETGYEFFDAATVTGTGIDGCRLTAESHKKPDEG